jgi:hypothetical protein
VPSHFIQVPGFQQSIANNESRVVSFDDEDDTIRVDNVCERIALTSEEIVHFWLASLSHASIAFFTAIWSRCAARLATNSFGVRREADPLANRYQDMTILSI